MLVGISPRYTDIIGVIHFSSCIVSKTQQVQIVHHTLSSAGAGIVSAPSPTLGDGTPHTIGKIFQRIPILQHLFGDSFNIGTVNVGVHRLTFSSLSGERLLTDGDKVFFLARQRTLNLEEVDLCHIIIINVSDVPLHLHLGLGTAQGRNGKSTWRMYHGKVLRL